MFFKFFIDWSIDPRFRSLSDRMFRRLMDLFALRSVVGDVRGLTDEERALALHCNPRQLEATRELFVAKGFIAEDWDMPHFDQRQLPSDPGAAERMREYRRRQAQRSANVTEDVTRNGPSPLHPRAREKNLEGNREERTKRARPRNVTDERTPNGPDPGDGPGWIAFLVAKGYPGEWAADVVAKMDARGQWRESYAVGILESYRRQGGPDRRPGESAPEKPPAAEAEPEPPAEFPEGPEGDALRALWARGG